MRCLTFSLAALALAVPAATASAQSTAMAGLGPVYQNVRKVLIASAEQMPEEHFAFKPTPEVRSFGQLIGHVANANYLLCSGAISEKNPNAEDFEKVASKAALGKAITASFEYCDKAYGIDDARGLEPVKVFWLDTNRLGVLAFQAGHNMEHYGNVVTYMRMKGLTPPSSQR